MWKGRICYYGLKLVIAGSIRCVLLNILDTFSLFLFLSNILRQNFGAVLAPFKPLLLI